MQIYLPIAEISIDLWILLALGTGVGFLSGLFGVGGGFLFTPLLIFIGVPPAVAVPTSANQIVAASMSGAIAHWRRRAIDFKMGAILTVGGAVGSAIGVWVFGLLRASGQVDLFVALAYVAFLSIIGGLMLSESVLALRRRLRGAPAQRQSRIKFLDALPFKTRFPRSGLYESVIPPIVLGVGIGALAALMGVGGGFIMVPAMIYLLRMPTNVVVGTSLMQILIVGAFTTLLQATLNKTVDIVLAGCLIVGGVIGAQLGARLASRLASDQLRAALAALVLLVGLKLALDLVTTPGEEFSIATLGAP